MQSDIYLESTDSDDDEYNSDSSGDLPITNNIGVKYDVQKDYTDERFLDQSRKDKYFDPEVLFSKHRCSTHPHQVHFEILAEHGLIGYCIILFILMRFIIKNIYLYRIKENFFDLNSIFYLLLFFIPLLPGSGIFSSFNGTYFWIIFSLLNLQFVKK